MENQTYQNYQLEDTVLVCRLSLERCRVYLAHLHAITHLLGRSFAADCPKSVSTRKLMQDLEKELESSISNLCRVLK